MLIEREFISNSQQNISAACGAIRSFPFLARHVQIRHGAKMRDRGCSVNRPAIDDDLLKNSRPSKLAPALPSRRRGPCSLAVHADRVPVSFGVDMGFLSTNPARPKPNLLKESDDLLAPSHSNGPADVAARELFWMLRRNRELLSPADFHNISVAYAPSISLALKAYQGAGVKERFVGPQQRKPNPPRIC